MLRQLVLLLLLAASVTAARAEDFVVRDASVNIPAPAGFVHVTEDMPFSLNAFASHQLVNRGLVAAFVPNSYMSQGGTGGATVLRTMVCAYPTQLLRTDSSGLDFTMYKISLKSSNRMDVHDALKDRQGWVQEFPEDSPRRVKMPLDVHHETASTISFSILDGVPDATGEITQGRATTITAVHVNQRILLLEATGPVSELQWTRDASADWAVAVLAANPLTTEESSATAVLASIGIILLVLIGVGGMALYLDKSKKESSS